MLEENIPQLFNIMADNYHIYAGVRLVMHYVTFFESFLDEGSLWSRQVNEIISKFNHLLKDSVSDHKGYEMEQTIRSVDELRNYIIKQMKMLTAYTDIFRIYEYVLNRVEYRFKENNNTIETEEFTRNVLRYIFDTQDNMIINEKIKEIVGQLPIRMTKQKYFDLLKDSFRHYLGADQSSLDSYLYNLRTSAMLHQEEGMKTSYPDLWKQKELFSGINYTQITREEYKKAAEVLKQAILFLEQETSVFYSLQEIINEFYAFLLCDPYAGMSLFNAENTRETVLFILQETNKQFMNNDNKQRKDLFDNLTKLEGVQEELSGDLTSLEDALYVVDQNYRKLSESIMLDKLLNVLLCSKDLLSNSLFIDWYEIKINNTVNEDMIKMKANELEAELADLFEKQDRAVSRAIMANTLSQIPVFFQNHKEVMDYILYSLERCSDIDEKSACMEIINKIMSE